MSKPIASWTDAQRRGIETTGHSLLVSAAAGSGKTTMLAQRCVHLVCDAPETCDVDELLVVTFTEAAAEQMKSRIHAALRDRVASRDSERLRRQVALMDHANVSTLHSFCARLLREHFHVVGLDPAFTVLDGEEAGLLRREIARELFDDRYELDQTGDFHRFIDAYGDGDDAPLIRRVIHTHDLLCSLVDPAGWLDRSRGRIAEAADIPLEETQLGRELIDYLSRGIADMRVRCAAAHDLVHRLGGFDGYLAKLSEWSQVLQHWDHTLRDFGIDALTDEMLDGEAFKLPSVRATVPNKELAKAAVESVRGPMKEGSWRDLLRFTSEQWRQALRDIGRHADVFLALVDDFGRRYRDAKNAARSVDFADLERFALQVLSEPRDGKLSPSPVARAYHRRFKHVLVDEYQDINEVQDAILSLLSRECVWDEPGIYGNLFCVGDVKQSIYRFRLAEAGRFLERQHLFRHDTSAPRRGEVIDLQSNFRSRGPLLEAINGVFERLMTAQAVDIEYDNTHRLQPGLTYPASTGQPCFAGSPIEMHVLPADLTSEDSDSTADSPEDELELDRSEREAVLVARRIRQIMGLDGSAPMCVMDKDASGMLTPRPIRFGDIVVLLRSMRYKSEQYADVLRRAGIPVHAQSSTGYFESTEIRDMLALLSILDNQRQDIPLAAVLRSPLADLPEPETSMARVRLAYPAAGELEVPFHDAIVRYAAENDDDLAIRLREFLARLEAWRRLAHSRPLAELIWTIYDQTGYLAFCSGLHDGQQRVANLMDLYERAAHFDTFQRQGLSRFMQFLESLREEADLGQPATASEADDVVRVMSIHRSKGLEFPVVVLPDLGKRINLSDAHGTIVADRTAGLGMDVIDLERLVRYPSLASVLVRQRLRQQAIAEEMRVLYVAMTRAREHLILVGTCPADAPDKWATQWSGHQGAFPADLIVGAKCMIEWLGPVAAADSKTIQVTRHTAEEVASWQSTHAKRPTLSPQQAKLAALQPLDPPPARSQAAADVIRRLEFRYPFQPFAILAAAQAVTRSPDGLLSKDVKAQTPAALQLPRFVRGQAMSPGDIGTATHVVLRHLDFRRDCDEPDLSHQIEEMVDRRLLSPVQAKSVDRDAVVWFLGTETGALLRRHADHLHRELPIHAAIVAAGLPNSDEPEDQVMLRGRIDVFLQTGSGALLIDYKTDKIRSAAVPARAEQYAVQMRQYLDALQQMDVGRIDARLVFLTARKTVSLHLAATVI